MTLSPLPIDAHVPRVVQLARERRAVVVVAEPGAGKTTRVPPALLQLGRVALLQPRRVAARAIARRVAHEQRLRLRDDVGWHVRFEREFTRDTRLLVMTEGVLTARLHDDPLLAAFDAVVLDEFHERSLHADLALALARQAQLARPGLALVVMSATLDAAPVAAFLGGAPVVEVPGRSHPVAVEHADLAPADAVRRVLANPRSGDVLCFLPGAGDIARVQRDLGDPGADVLPLHGGLDADAQDLALAPSRTGRRKVVLATNVAETSLTVEGVTDVVDSGWHKVSRHDAATGLDRLCLERIPLASAKQRAGRAGRLGPGRVLRLWDEQFQLRRFLEPEIARVSLAAPFLDVLAWGADPRTFAWFEAPPQDASDAAMALLERLGVARSGRITPLGRALHAIPADPRLARVLLAAGGSRRAALACALLSDRLPRRDAHPPTTDSDLLALLDDERSIPSPTRQLARQLEAAASHAHVDELRERAADAAAGDDALRRALLAGFPDRVARRREPRGAALLLASGTGAVLGRESGVREAEWLLALDVQRGDQGEALVGLASAVDREWLEPDAVETVHALDREGRVRAHRIERLGALELARREVEPEDGPARELLARALAERPLGDDDERFVRRARAAGIDVDARALLAAAGDGRSLPRIPLQDATPHAVRARVDDLAPETLEVPSGRRLRLDYRADGTVALAVKLQELFGLAQTPSVGAAREPVLLELLSPAGRPVQSTRDLRSFWERTYPEVRKELRSRYPRHPWPEDPWSALPTHRTAPRRR